MKARPQILVFILPSKDAGVYTRIKKSADCRYGVMSQCMQAAHVAKNQPQYHSNVCMKFNAKLGGTTNKVALVSPITSLSNGFPRSGTSLTQFIIARQTSDERSFFKADHDHRSRCVSWRSWVSTTIICSNDHVPRSVLLALRCGCAD